jgi:ribosomal protein S18 acetylase RimI-like enzyme
VSDAARCQSASGNDFAPGNEGCLAGGKKKHDVCDLIGACLTAQWNDGAVGLDMSCRRGMRERGSNGGRVNRVDTDAVTNELKGGRLRQAAHGAAIALLGLPENHFFMAEVDGSAVGYVYAEIAKQSETAAKYALEVVYVHHLYVRPAFRRHGIGRALLDAVRAVGAEQGIARLTLDVWTFNEAARTFFRGYGLKPYNERLCNG